MLIDLEGLFLQNGRINSKAISESKFEEIIQNTPHVFDKTRKSIVERVFCIKNNIIEIPKCKCCKTSDVNFSSSSPRKYNDFCSPSCKVKFKRKNTSVEDKTISAMRVSRYNLEILNIDYWLAILPKKEAISMTKHCRKFTKYLSDDYFSSVFFKQSEIHIIKTNLIDMILLKVT